jgi:hypothetical protein
MNISSRNTQQRQEGARLARRLASLQIVTAPVLRNDSQPPITDEYEYPAIRST